MAIRMASRVWERTDVIDRMHEAANHRAHIHGMLGSRWARDLLAAHPELLRESDGSEGRKEFILDVVVMTPDEYEALKNALDPERRQEPHQEG